MTITIRKKLLILLAAIAGTYSVAVAFILFNFNARLSEEARSITIARLRENASNAAAILNSDFEIVRTVASVLTNTLEYETVTREEVTRNILSSTTAQRKRYLSTWLSIELSMIDTGWHKPFGRKRYTYYQTGDPVFDTVNTNGDIPGSLYFALKQSRKESLTEPYLLSSTAETFDDRNNVMGTSICVPLLHSGKFVGLAGIDITLESLNFITNAKPYPGSSSFLISNEGVLVAHEDPHLVGKPLTSLTRLDATSLLSDIKQGKSRDWITSDGEYFVAFTPIKISQSGLFWSIGTIVPMTAVTSAVNSILIRTILISLAGLAILIIAIHFISQSLSKPVRAVNDRLKELASGRITTAEINSYRGTAEIAEIFESANLLSENIQKKIKFAVEIGNGRFDTEFSIASQDDTLGMALKSMQQNLRQVRMDEERRLWQNEGIALLNDVVRESHQSPEHYYLNILRAVVSFMNANQGALFLVENNSETGERWITLTAAYAYERPKHISKRIPWGDTALGQALLEGELLYLKEIPKNYITITSGLGHATPRVLVIAPIKVNEEVIGAIELASFTELEKHQLTYIQKACDIVGSALRAVRVQNVVDA